MNWLTNSVAKKKDLFYLSITWKKKKSELERLGVDITPATCNKYKCSAKHVQEFLLTEFKVKNHALHRLYSSFLDKYFHTCEPLKTSPTTQQ
jgi:hypothetical protein